MKSVNPNVGIKGFDIVLSNLNKSIKAFEAATLPGLMEAAAFVREDMDKTPPLIPIDTGHLRDDSWSVVPLRAGNNIGITMGFSANYALFVHEMIGPTSTGKKINWNRPGSGPKFFEAAVKRNYKNIMTILRDNIKIEK